MTTPEERRARVVSFQEYQEERRRRIERTFQLDPTVSITLKGKAYTLEYNNYAVKGILRDTLFNMLARGLDKEALESPDILGAALYWGLKTHHPDLSQDDADKLYTYRHYGYIISKITDAVSLFTADMSDFELDTPLEPSEESDPTKPPTPIG